MGLDLVDGANGNNVLSLGYFAFERFRLSICKFMGIEKFGKILADGQSFGRFSGAADGYLGGVFTRGKQLVDTLQDIIHAHKKEYIEKHKKTLMSFVRWPNPDEEHDIEPDFFGIFGHDDPDLVKSTMEKIKKECLVDICDISDADCKMAMEHPVVFEVMCHNDSGGDMDSTICGKWADLLDALKRQTKMLRFSRPRGLYVADTQAGRKRGRDELGEVDEPNKKLRGGGEITSAMNRADVEIDEENLLPEFIEDLRKIEKAGHFLHFC